MWKLGGGDDLDDDLSNKYLWNMGKGDQEIDISSESVKWELRIWLRHVI